MAVDGDRAGLVVFDRTGQPARLRLIVRNLRTGRERTRHLSVDSAPSLTLAGRYVALLEQHGDRDLTRITVRDLRNWRVRTRAVVREDSLDVGLALRRDGALAIAYGQDRRRAVLVRPTSQRLRRLSPRPSSLEIRFGRQGVIYPHRVRGGVHLVEARWSGAARQLTSTIRGFVSFDVDGDRLALRTKRCVYLAPIPALAPIPSCSVAAGRRVGTGR
jgi:hypothetical protein